MPPRSLFLFDLYHAVAKLYSCILSSFSRQLDLAELFLIFLDGLADQVDYLTVAVYDPATARGDAADAAMEYAKEHGLSVTLLASDY